MWDREAFYLIHKTADELKQQVSQGSASVNGLPKEIQEIVGERAMFNVDINFDRRNPNEIVYSVNLITNNSGFLDLLPPMEESDSKEYNSDSDLELLFDVSAMVESKTGESLLDDYDHTPHETPSKRSLSNDADGSGSGPTPQNSSTKLPRVVKQEKP